MRTMLATFILCVGFSSWTVADVYYKEEVVNPGMGAKKQGHRKTINKVYIKGQQQKVESSIETDDKTIKALKKQGQAINSSVILRLDKKDVYEVDLDKYVFFQEKIPPVAKVAAKPVAKKVDDGTEKKFAINETKEEETIAGIKCKKVLARLTVNYRDPKTKKPIKQNIYDYTAWIAKDFPGYKEIMAFEKKQQQETSYPALVSGSLEQLKNTVEDYESLASEMEALDGFVLRSKLEVSVRTGAKKSNTVFQLEREVKEFRHVGLADSIFQVSKDFTKIDKE